MPSRIFRPGVHPPPQPPLRKGGDFSNRLRGNKLQLIQRDCPKKDEGDMPHCQRDPGRIGKTLTMPRILLTALDQRSDDRSVPRLA